jgi:hypothetical protein
MPCMKNHRTRPVAQPKPSIPGISRQMVQEHARRLFRDIYPQRSLTEPEWRLVEADLVRKMERDGF